MANFFDQFDGGADVAPMPRVIIDGSSQSPEARAIKSIESDGSGGYRAVGPRTGKGRALGAYQIMDFNVGPWSREILGRAVSEQEFLDSPEIQDAIFNGKFGQYAKKHGLDGASRAWFAGEDGMNDMNRRDVLGTTVADYARKFRERVSQRAMSFAPEQTPAAQPVNFFDQFDGPAPATIAERSDIGPEPENADALRSGLQRRAKELTTGPERGRMYDILQGYLNQGSAASQGTTPNIAAQSKNLISTETFESDAGELQYRDPQTGEIKNTDQNKHVALRDPADGRIKVYARTEETDEGRLSSAGRLLGTGMATGAPTRLASPVARAPTAAPALTPSQEVSQAAQRIGVDLPRAVTTDSMVTQRVAAGVRNVPGAGDPLIKATGRAVQQLGDKASDIAGDFGGGTVAGSGDAARGGIKNYITGKSAETSNKFYNRVDELVDNSIKTPLNNTARAAMEILGRRANAGITDPSGAVKRIEAAVTKEGGLNYQGLKDLRGYIRELKDNPSLLPADLSGKELNKIYDALSADLRAAVKNAGGDKALVAFDRANKHYALLSKRREDLAKIVGQNADAPPERVFDRLVAMASGSSRADINGLVQARKAIGADDWNEFVSGVIQQMGRAPAARGAPETLQGADFSPERFLTAYNKLSDAGRGALFRSGGLSSHADALKDIATVSSRFRELQKFANPSGTAQTGAGFGLGAWMMAEPLTAIGAVLGGRGLAMALANPAKASSVAKVVRAQESLAKSPTPAKIAAYNIAARNLISTLGTEAKMLSPADFLRALQGPVPSRAEDEN